MGNKATLELLLSTLELVWCKSLQVIRNLVSPGKPTDKFFEELINLVKKHQNPRPSAIGDRFKIHSRL